MSTAGIATSRFFENFRFCAQKQLVMVILPMASWMCFGMSMSLQTVIFIACVVVVCPGTSAWIMARCGGVGGSGDEGGGDEPWMTTMFYCYLIALSSAGMEEQGYSPVSVEVAYHCSAERGALELNEIAKG